MWCVNVLLGLLQMSSGPGALGCPPSMQVSCCQTPEHLRELRRRLKSLLPTTCGEHRGPPAPLSWLLGRIFSRVTPMIHLCPHSHQPLISVLALRFLITRCPSRLVHSQRELQALRQKLAQPRAVCALGGRLQTECPQHTHSSLMV